MFHWTGEVQALKFEFHDLEDGSGKQYSDKFSKSSVTLGEQQCDPAMTDQNFQPV